MGAWTQAARCRAAGSERQAAPAAAAPNGPPHGVQRSPARPILDIAAQRREAFALAVVSQGFQLVVYCEWRAWANLQRMWCRACRRGYVYKRKWVVQRPAAPRRSLPLALTPQRVQHVAHARQQDQGAGKMRGSIAIAFGRAAGAAGRPPPLCRRSARLALISHPNLCAALATVPLTTNSRERLPDKAAPLPTHAACHTTGQTERSAAAQLRVAAAAGEGRCPCAAHQPPHPPSDPESDSRVL